MKIIKYLDQVLVGNIRTQAPGGRHPVSLHLKYGNVLSCQVKEIPNALVIIHIPRSSTIKSR